MLLLLRNSFPDWHFRRQVSIGIYTVDFASHRVRLIIEVDGGQHSEPRDAQRTRALKSAGYRVIRFWNHDVLSNPEGVAAVVEGALVSSATPNPTLPHTGGGSRAEPVSWRV